MSENADIQRGQGEVLTDPHRLKSDMNLILRSINEGWNVPADKKKTVVDRLFTIVDKRECQVMTKEGIVMLDGPADSNAIKAASVLVAMTGEKQRDVHVEDKNQRLAAGEVTERVAHEPVILRQPVQKV